MFKKISVFLVFALVIAALSACAPDGQLTAREKAHIEKAWYAQASSSEETWSWDPEDEACCLYYGNVEGYDIILKPSGTRPWHEETVIGESTFTYKYPFVLYTYKDGNMNTVDNLYNRGKISQQAVAEIAKRHANGETQKLSKRKQKAMPEARAKMEWFLDWEAEDGEPSAVRYYGNFEGYDVLFIFPWKVEGIPGDQLMIDGIEFRVPVGNYAFIAYKDGKIERVYELYGKENGFSKEVFESIIQEHNKYDNG